ncbi:MAG: four helix bundle protein [Bacteroidota bacterium]
MRINRFEDLEIWKLARDLCEYVKGVTEQEPFSKDYKFRNQIRSSSGSVMDNIAEGFERDGKQEFIQHLSISKGSCGETRSQSYRAFDYKYITELEFKELLERTEILGKRIGNFIKYLKSSPHRGTKFRVF